MKLIKNLGIILPTERCKEKVKCALYECSCGKRFVTRIKDVKNGKIQSCGCLRSSMLSKRNTSHGMANTKLYGIWEGIKKRCNNQNSPNYSYYGGRGIKICDDWNSSFESFYIWSINNGYKEGLTIDRKDNDGNYYPDNCRWVTLSVNCRNQRIRKTNTSGYRGVSYDKNGHKWHAYVFTNNKLINLGRYKIIEDAALAYNNYVIKYKTGHILNIIK
ncbi:MAG: AP2 domain-containing protein [Candidatus Nanoarchaeia archaeon]|nr:AP2 domain-containing protein [Candidatus Nanoarchaeia archaeon]